MTYTPPPDESYPATSALPSTPPAPGAYTSPAESAPAAPAKKRTSPVAGVIALLGGAAAIVGSLLQWGKGSVVSSAGIEKSIFDVAGFDSNGLLTAICGGALIVLALLFFTGVPRQLFWAILAFVGGGVIVGAAVFSMIDIADLSNRYATEWQTTAQAAVGDVVSTQSDLGLFIAAAGGVLGVLAAPFANRQ